MYAPYFLSCSTSSVPFQLTASVMLGFGGSLLWVSQGSILTASSCDEDRERDTGIFWACYMGGNTCGNLSASLILSKFDVSTQILFLVFAGACILGSPPMDSHV